MRLNLTAWRWLARAAAVMPAGPRHFRESQRGRAAATERWATWSGGRVVWFHAASVGEMLTADPVMRRFRVARPDLAVVLTYTSPSVEQWPNPIPAVHADFAPAENHAAMERAFAALNPALLVFSCGDLWPEMLVAARRRGVPVTVVGGRIRPGSRRLNWPARPFLRACYQSIRFVGAASAGDAALWRLLAPPEVVHVTGDPRHDQVLERPIRMDALRQITARTAGGPTLVAGSIENDDVAPLLEAYRQVRARRPDARLVIVPHDPGSRAAEPFRAVPEVIVVSSLGVLADLYLAADMAYVGGGFGSRGAHALAEPATFGIPTLVSSANLARQWLAWIEDPAAARSAGLSARRTLQSGAARVSTDRLLALLAKAPPSLSEAGSGD